MKIGVLLYTYNRVDDARINLEIIRNVWKKSDLLRHSIVIHAFNGKKGWWPKKYLEDDLLYLENPGHFSGAEILLNEGVARFIEKHHDIDYVIVLASDTWCVRPEYIEKVISEMQANEQHLAACAWGKKGDDVFRVGTSMDFFIINLPWATKKGLFPIRYQEFSERYGELLSYQDTLPYLERLFAVRFKQAVMRDVKLPSENLMTSIARMDLRRITEREPVHFSHRPVLGVFGRPFVRRKMYWPEIGLITHHDPVPKQKTLKQWNLELGEYGKRFLGADDLTYYNEGLTKLSYSQNGKKIDYGD